MLSKDGHSYNTIAHCVEYIPHQYLKLSFDVVFDEGGYLGK
jgi:hypothetical protein